eukprot:1053532-Pleurochrysis_carterae.AAC.10
MSDCVDRYLVANRASDVKGELSSSQTCTWLLCLCLSLCLCRSHQQCSFPPPPPLARARLYVDSESSWQVVDED